MSNRSTRQLEEAQFYAQLANDSFEAMRVIVFAMILHPPSDYRETHALTYFRFAKIWEERDLELACGLQIHSQVMSPTPEGAKYLDRLLTMRNAGPQPPLTRLERAARDKLYQRVERALRARIPK